MKQTTQAKQSGVSFQPANKYGNFKRETNPVKIGGIDVTTSAQAQTVIAYGDSYNMPFRNLGFKCGCDDFADLIRCIEIIKSYNEFDADRIKKHAFFALNLQHYLNERNPNNGKSLFEFHIAREGSPAFYVNWNEKYGKFIIKDTEPVEASEGQEAGDNLYWEEYTAEDFKQSMADLSGKIGADEFDIEEDYTYPDGTKSFTARFWFD